MELKERQVTELFRSIIFLSEFGASERLFLDNPTMDGDGFSRHRPSWGQSGMIQFGGDHAAVLPDMYPDMIEDQVA